MHSLSLHEIARIVGGQLHGDGNVVVTGIATNSQSVHSGDLFCAIVGQRVNGHDFVEAAYLAGARAVLCTSPVTEPCVVVPSGVEIDGVILALGKIAQHVRGSLSDVELVGVTGSSGKTSTKDLIGQVLSTVGVTQSPEGSPNNELGLPLTILQAPEGTQFYVLEMGMRGMGHIAYLCDIAHPTIGVVTNVGRAHIGEVGSIENIALAKSELISSLPADGVAILNADDERVLAMAALARCQVVTFGESENAEMRARNIVMSDDGTTDFVLDYLGDSEHVHLTLIGRHNVSNALAAAAVGVTVGMTLPDIAQALSSAVSKSKWRMERHELPRGVTLINDAYNANPESMLASLKALGGYPADRTKWAVIAGMHELGQDSNQAHADIAAHAVDAGVNHLVVIGELARPAYDSGLELGLNAVWLPNIEQAADYIGQKVAARDVLLFKASRSEGLERLAALVQEQIEKGAQA